MRSLLLCAFALAGGAAQAQTMYKCVDANGKTSYADQPCASKTAARKEIDVRANLDDAARENRRKADKLEREQEEARYNARNADLANDPQAQRMERELRLMEGEPAERTPTTYAEVMVATAKRVKADEEARAKASALWKCQRGPEPEKCQ